MRLGREQRMRVVVAAVVLGTAALVALASWTGRLRDTDLADASDDVTAEFLHGVPDDAPELAFTEVAAEAGVAAPHAPGRRHRLLPEDTGSGVAWGDVDGDGDPDLYAVDFEAPNRLFLNRGDGTFEEAAARAGVADEDGFGMGATFADFDADGDLDLHVTNRGPDRLFVNRGDGTFREAAAEAGVDSPLWSTGAAWGDFDRDGDLDFYVVSYVDFQAGDGMGGTGHGAGRWNEVPFTLNPNAFDPQPNRLYLNRGDGSFEELALSSGVSDPGGRGLAATACDLDGDGWLDLYVNNDVSPNALFRNQGADGLPALFEDWSAPTGTADPRGSMGLSVTDLALGDGAPDGLPDLFISHWVAQENALYEAVRGPGGRLEYRDRSRRARLAEISIERVGWGSAFADLDLDGRADLVVANGSTLEEAGEPARLASEPLFVLWNDGERFHDLAPVAGEALERPHDGRGLAAADYDGDGDVDLAVAVNRGPLLLLRNDTATRHRSLTVSLDGPPAASFGARVEVETRAVAEEGEGGGASTRKQVRWRGCDASFLSAHDPALVFGLGGAERVRRVRVAWADGEETVLEDLPPGEVTVRHPAAGP